ncbi:MAG: bifunctional adenosylcobinamide kinase/adenosylcobinamide-phosphate guanylyltransferase [Butyrivibrio sp.]|nr:bifunctional adenosylcobinamide kinase/adenosylcobinamide-phosphate guanylyltransferase [Butyrivibrio sp.]
MVLIIGGSHQGKTEYAKDNFKDFRILDDLHLYIKKRLSEGIEESEILSEIKDTVREGSWVIIADELGNGVVPMEPFDRKYREVTGRILIEIAANSNEVYRVVCGLGQKIK